MPRIPQVQPRRDSHISDFRVATTLPKNIGVSKASPERHIDIGGREMVEAARGALLKIAEVYAERHEEVRTSESQKLQMGVNEYFRGRKIEESKAVGSQSLGLVDNLKNSTEELREQFVTDDLDKRTSTELNSHFDNEYNRHALWLTNFSIKQSDVADTEARIMTIQDAHSNIALLPAGNLDGVDKEVSKTLVFELGRHPNLTDSQIELDRRSLKEDYLTFAMTKWRQDNPTSASALWEANQDYFKKALPNNFNTMAQKMEVTKEDAGYDVALGTLERIFGEDDAAAAKYVDEDTDNTLGLTQTQRLKVSSMLWSSNSHKLAEQKRVQDKKDEDYLLASHEKFVDPETGITNIPAALADLEQTYREGGIDSSLYEERREKLTAAVEEPKFSSNDSHNLMSDINNGDITTKREILNAITGTDAKPEPYYSELKKRQDQISEGYTDNWFNVAYSKYTALASIDKPKNLPSGISKEALLVDITELPNFKKRLETIARLAGLSAGDPEIVNLANILLESGWYSKRSPEWHTGEAGFFTVGEKYGRVWQLPMEEMQEVLRQRGLETATGGSPKEYTPEENEAIARLHDNNIPVTTDSIQRAIGIISREKGEE